jgi:hypothetical protein
MIFAKKLGARLIRAKGQTHPGSSEIGMSLCKIQKITLKVCAMKQELIYIYPRWSIIYVGCCAQLFVSRFGSCLTKKPDFRTPKMENILFMGQNKHQPLWSS